MNASTDPLDRFVRAVHRRQVVLRIIEGAGIGLGAASGVAAALVVVMLWQGQDAWAVAAVALAAGAGGGALWGIGHRPTALAAAAEADRQLASADLLSTAWAVRDAFSPAGQDGSFRRAVLTLAAARCERLSPSAVLLRRFGVRGWGGITLSVALVATLAAMSSNPLEAGAGADLRAPSARAMADSHSRPVIEIAVDAPRHPRRVEQVARENNPASNDPSAVSAETADKPADAPPPDARDRSASDTSPGSGSASSKTPPPTPRREDSQIVSPGRVENDASQPKFDPPNPAGGVGQAARDTTRAAAVAEGAVGGVVEADGDGFSPAPWQSPAWPAAVEKALDRARSARIPDDARDLVRGYFDPAGAAQRR